MAQVERETSVPEALSNAYEAAAALGGRLRLEYLHRGPYPVTRSQLVRDGSVCAEGVGKGEGRQAELSAVFEALEHYFLLASNQTADFLLKPIPEIASQPLLQADRLIHYVAKSHPDAQAGCALYTDLWNEHLTAWVPLFVVDPTYAAAPIEGDDLQYREYCRYGTSTGCAAGSTATEACLHGLLESVERDALGRFFLNRFNVESDHEVPLLDETYLSTPLLELIGELSARSQGTVRIIDLTTQVGIPVYMAECRGRDYPLGAFGCGCSLDPLYAVERAITELLQNIVEGRWSLVDSYFRAAIQHSPNHRRLSLAPDRDVHVRVPLPRGRSPLPVTPSDSFAVALTAARHSGLVPLVRVTSPPELAVTVVSVYVAGAERFYLARWGHRLDPTGLENLRPETTPPVVDGLRALRKRRS
ncbi:MAG TPA: YcaO-like family protein [Gaiellaceae bacterium]|nr:YcaO-like family protein [Gaiellaceae bacterium]